MRYNAARNKDYNLTTKIPLKSSGIRALRIVTSALLLQNYGGECVKKSFSHQDRSFTEHGQGQSGNPGFVGVNIGEFFERQHLKKSP